MRNWMPLLGSVVFVAAASGQSLYSDNFNDGSAAGRLKVTGGADTGVLHPSINYAFDYAAAGLSIPAAPRGGGFGLKVDVNTLATAKSAEGLNLYPLVGATPLSVSGDFALKFDVYQYAIGSSGTTEDAIGGINASGDRSNWYMYTDAVAANVQPGTDGNFFSATADGGNNEDYNSYAANGGPANGVSVRHSFEETDSVPQQIFPDSSGTPRGQWNTWEIRQINNKITWKLNGQTVDTFDNSGGTFTTGTPFIGYQDIFDSVNNNVFGVFDNLNVTRAGRFTGSGSFNVAGNWASGTVPTGADAIAAFDAGGGSVSLAGGASVNGVVFDSASPYTLANGSLLLTSNGDNTYIDVRQGTHTISATTVLARTTAFQLDGDVKLNVTNLQAGTSSLIATGGGELIVNQLRQGGVRINDTRVTIATSATPSTNGGRVTSLNFYAQYNSQADTYSPKGRLDLNNNGLAVDYTATSPLTTLSSLVQLGYNGGNWLGTDGITSSTAIASAGGSHPGAVGIAEASEVRAAPSTFLGATIDSTTVLIRYTYAGDTNLDGTVDTLDFARLVAGFGNTARWSLGDFNYDGTVDSADFTGLVANYGFTVAGGSLPAGAPGSVVPEPVTLSTLLIAGVVLRRRR